MVQNPTTNTLVLSSDPACSTSPDASLGFRTPGQSRILKPFFSFKHQCAGRHKHCLSGPAAMLAACCGWHNLNQPCQQLCMAGHKRPACSALSLAIVVMDITSVGMPPDCDNCAEETGCMQPPRPWFRLLCGSLTKPAAAIRSATAVTHTTHTTQHFEWSRCQPCSQ